MKSLHSFYLMSALIAGLLIVAGCFSGKPDVEKAKKVAEDYLQKIDKGDYDNAWKLYSPEFSMSESPESRIEKFKKLKEVFGDIQSMELVSSSIIEGDEGVELNYKVTHSQRTSLEKLIMVVDEGEHKVGMHMVGTE